MVAEAESYVGLMSGTSMDAVDAVLVRFHADRPELLATLSVPLPAMLRQDLWSLSRAASVTLDDLGRLDRELGELFAAAVKQLLHGASCGVDDVRAIGSHGQTIRHRPGAPLTFTLQIADPNVIAEQTGITTVADFRRRDMAAGGQGAPLAPVFHGWLLRRHAGRHAVLNLGGIANISMIEDGMLYGGFDTGPANTLLDAWCREHRNLPYDERGEWAAGGQVHAGLLARLCDEPYLRAAPPKSTGFELFNLAWLQAHLDAAGTIAARDVMATLAQFTVESICTQLERHWAGCQCVHVCGGGHRNEDLMQRLRARLPAVGWQTTATLGAPPAWMEAMAFAWLARARLAEQPASSAAVTGARSAVVLGGVYF